MPGMTLIGEAMTFAHDQELLGFCLDEHDEPAGDDFATRCKEKRFGRYIDSRNPEFSMSQIEMMDGVDRDAADETDGVDRDDVDEGEVSDVEVRDRFAQFCDMSSRAQASEVDRLKHLACQVLSVNIRDFEIPDGFALDCIERGLSNREFAEEVRMSFSNRFGFVRKIVLTAEDRKLVAKVALMDDHWHFAGQENIGDEDLAISQQGGHAKNNCLRRESEEYKIVRVERDIREIKGNHSRSRVYNSRRRTCFYRARRETMRRQWDLYNEDPQEIKMQRQDEAFRVLDEEFNRETLEVQFLSVRDQLMMHNAFVVFHDQDDDLMDDDELNYALRQMQGWKDTDYSPYPRLRVVQEPITPIYHSPMDDFGSDDDWDDWYEGIDNEPAHPATCYCGECLAERFANGEDHCGDPMCNHCNSVVGIFTGLGEDDRSIDEDLVKFGSTARIRNSVARGRRA